MYEDAIAAHYVYAISLSLNMLGKQLGSKNYTFWVKRRRQTCSSPLGLSKDDPILDDLTVSRSVAERTYSDVKIYFQVRRLLFLNIYVLSKGNETRKGSGNFSKLTEVCRTFQLLYHLQLDFSSQPRSMGLERVGQVLAINPSSSK